MQSRLPQHDVVLLGAGHTHVHVLRRARMQPLPATRLTCISQLPTATYSGMLPGTLAGLYAPDQMEIDLVRLCASAGARLILGEVTGLNCQTRRLQLADRPDVPFDVLSIGIGSTPRRDGLFDEPPEMIVPIKPMQTFLQRFDARLRDVANLGRTLRLVVVGGGAAGSEIALAVPPHLHSHFPGAEFTLSLIERHTSVARDLSPGAAARLQRHLERHSRLILGRYVVGFEPGSLRLDDGTRVPCDLALWATSATAPPLLGRLGLPTDERGFLLTRPTLQTVADAPIFVVGDSGTLATDPTPKAGVYAVRQGPILWENLGRMLRGEPLIEYRPQRGFLKLLSTGDGRAILDYRGLAAEGRWCWRLKNRIDRRFIEMYQAYEAPRPMARSDDDSAEAMRCAGCGGKVAGSVLARVLRRLEIPPSDAVLVGLEQPDDVAVLRIPGDANLIVTADFFAAFVDDPYLVGRVAALNAASDLFASGAQPAAALALATIPPGPEQQQEQSLFELLAGGVAELQRMGATLVGGHTIEGPQTTIGFTLIAHGRESPRLKGQLRAGDVLVLTKPLGTGVLLAAHQQASCRAAWYRALVELLLVSNRLPEGFFARYDIAGATDVTGFGLAGHLMEMLRASDLTAEISLAAVPCLDGAVELSAAGIASTLTPANRAVEVEVAAPDAIKLDSRYPLLFDPQTSGGLLLGVPQRWAEEVVRVCCAHFGLPAAAIGRALPSGGAQRLSVL